MKKLKATSIQDLLGYSQGTLVEFPPFSEGQPFIPRVKRPSLLIMVKNGKIPNELLTTANSLFAGGQVINIQDKETMKTLFDVLDIIAEATFVEPTYKELKDNNIELTDDQYMFLFNYTQTGVAALKPFREEQGDTEPNLNVKDVPEITQ